LKPASKATLAKILKYHVVNGKNMAGQLTEGANVLKTLHGAMLTVTKAANGDVTVGDANAKVSTADQEADNGVAHIIDKVLTPPNIVKLADATSDLSSLHSALVAADLVTALSGTGPFTVFAPTNAAFTALADPDVTELLKPASKATLAKILKYHVVSGSSTSAGDLTEGANVLKTLQGAKVTVTKAANGDVTIGDTKVTTADQVADNGMVHIIDKVLIPPSTSTDASTSPNASASGCLGCRSCISWAITLSFALCFSIFAV